MKSKLRNFCRNRNQNNTQYKTKSHLNTWKKFCESLKESRRIENIPANELYLLLSKCFNATFLFGHKINILLTKLGLSVWENLDLMVAGTDLTVFGLY